MTTRKKSLFEQARKAKPRTDAFPIPLVDHDEAEALTRALAAAKAEDRTTQRFGPDADKKTSAAALAKAQAAFDAAHEVVRFHGLTAVELDASTNEHPDPPEGGDEPEGHIPFIYHLAVASAVPSSPCTAEEWKSLCEESWNVATATAFRQTVLNVNGQPYSTGLPKD